MTLNNLFRERDQETVYMRKLCCFIDHFRNPHYYGLFRPEEEEFLKIFLSFL